MVEWRVAPCQRPLTAANQTHEVCRKGNQDRRSTKEEKSPCGNPCRYVRSDGQARQLQLSRIRQRTRVSAHPLAVSGVLDGSSIFTHYEAARPLLGCLTNAVTPKGCEIALTSYSEKFPTASSAIYVKTLLLCSSPLNSKKKFSFIFITVSRCENVRGELFFLAKA